MLWIITALPIEAQPFIKKYRLVQLKTPKFCIYQNEFITLIITWPNYQASFLCTNHLLSFFPQIQTVLNFGIAGSLQTKQPFGTVYNIWRIYDTIFNKEYITNYQESAIFQNLALKELVTSAQIISTSDEKEKLKIHGNLVDLEGSAITYTCEKFGINYYILKMVSDQADFKNKLLAKNKIKEALNKTVHTLDFYQLISSQYQFDFPINSIFSKLFSNKSEQAKINLYLNQILKQGYFLKDLHPQFKEIIKRENNLKKKKKAIINHLLTLLPQK